MAYKYGDKYKFKSLKVYCSTEWMFGATKKYRQVFDKDEVDYIRAEFSFYNKLFDEEKWTAAVMLKAFDISGGKRREICTQEEKAVVTPDKNVVTIYKGWGSDAIGGFWKKGAYIWEAYIDKHFVGSQRFYIEEIGKVSPKNNPYFDVVSLKVYNGPYDGWNIEKRNYLKQFDRETTQFVWAEFKFRCKTNTDWNSEIFVNFYDDAGQMKGQAVALDYISKGSKGKIFTIQEGWGNKEGGSWKDEKYTVEIVFMDTLVAVLPFEVGDGEIQGTQELQSPEQATMLQQSPEEDDQTLEEVMQLLDELIGLQGVKRQIKDHINYLEFIKLRREKGFQDEEQLGLHSVFTGNPGTGKTTVVNLLGKIYHKMGLLSSGHVHEVDRATLVGEFIGQTAPKTKQAIDEARGGILFVDEAYMLVRNNEDPKDFGKEVIEVLIKEMSDGPGDIAIMAAGYPDEMEAFINSNPGLKSRFNYFFHFDDYTPGELLEIAEYACEKRSVRLSGKALKYMERLLVEAYRNRDKSFGNARYAYSLVDGGKMNLGLRLMKKPDVKKMTNIELSTIEEQDLRKLVKDRSKRKVEISIDELLLRETMQELSNLIGLNEIKTEINELVKLVRYYRETGKDVLNRFSLHTVFKGNPGTGKTTIARLIGKIYKALGLLERGHIVECDRESLIAGYIGQTAIKTKEKIDQAVGGVLFIDEAYALTGSQSSYGNEAIEVLLKNMEDKRGDFALIVAGYPKKMEDFLRSNPGLRSRFDRTFDFKDFTPDQLYKIGLLMLSQESLIPDKEAEQHLKAYLNMLHRNRDKYFGNAREVRKMVEQAIKTQHLRMASIPSVTRTDKIMETLTFDDVKNFQLDAQRSQSGGIGFKY